MQPRSMQQCEFATIDHTTCTAVVLLNQQVCANLRPIYLVLLYIVQLQSLIPCVLLDACCLLSVPAFCLGSCSLYPVPVHLMFNLCILHVCAVCTAAALRCPHCCCTGLSALALAIRLLAAIIRRVPLQNLWGTQTTKHGAQALLRCTALHCTDCTCT